MKSLCLIFSLIVASTAVVATSSFEEVGVSSSINVGIEKIHIGADQLQFTTLPTGMKAVAVRVRVSGSKRPNIYHQLDIECGVSGLAGKACTGNKLYVADRKHDDLIVSKVIPTACSTISQGAEGYLVLDVRSKAEYLVTFLIHEAQLWREAHGNRSIFMQMQLQEFEVPEKDSVARVGGRSVLVHSNSID